jgi:hypothetical protein
MEGAGSVSGGRAGAGGGGGGRAVTGKGRRLQASLSLTSVFFHTPPLLWMRMVAPAAAPRGYAGGGKGVGVCRRGAQRARGRRGGAGGGGAHETDARARSLRGRARRERVREGGCVSCAVRVVRLVVVELLLCEWRGRKESARALLSDRRRRAAAGRRTATDGRRGEQRPEAESMHLTARFSCVLIYRRLRPATQKNFEGARSLSLAGAPAAGAAKSALGVVVGW